MLNTMTIQLLAEAKNWQYLYYFGDTVVYKAMIDGYTIVMEVKQNPAIIYNMETVTELLDHGYISICNLIITDTTLSV